MNACIAPSLVNSVSNEEISKGILRSRTTALTNTWIAVAIFIPNSWHNPSNCLLSPSSIRTLNVVCAILNTPLNIQKHTFPCRTCTALFSANIYLHYSERAEKINRAEIALFRSWRKRERRKTVFLIESGILALFLHNFKIQNM